MLKYYQDWSGLFAEQLCARASAKPAAEILRQCLAIGKLRSAINNLSNLQVGTATHLQNLWLDGLDEAEAIDRELEEWERGLTGRWRRQTINHRLLLTMIEVTLEFYNDIQVGKVWNQYRCARIFLHETIIQIAEHLLSTGGLDDRERLVHQIKDSAKMITTSLSAICESIPFHLQQVDSKGNLVTQTPMKVLGGEHLLWPLEVVFMSPWSSDSQRAQSCKALQEIGSSLGLLQASKTVLRELDKPTKIFEHA